MTPAPVGSSRVVCRGLAKRYGAVTALAGLDLAVEPGEIVALLGPSGCGKTTTLRLIAGFDAPDAGTIRIGDRLVAGDGAHVPPERRRVGMVFQDFALFPHLTAAENVAYGLHRIRSADERRAHVARMLGLVGLAGLGDRPPHALSGGQQQRVALARALAPGPEVLLLDEPFSNLDARMRHAVRDEVRSILKATGTTALFVTHDQEEAWFMGDRVALLNGGHLEQVAAPEAMFARPATRFVADFLGHTGFLEGRATGAGIDTELGLVPSAVLPPGTPVDVLVRPNDVELAGDGGVPAVVDRRIFQGLHVLYRLRLPSGAAVKCLAPPDAGLSEGDAARVRLVPGRALAVFRDGRAVGDDPASHPGVL